MWLFDMVLFTFENVVEENEYNELKKNTSNVIFFS